MENSDVGEHEDADVKAERQKVFDLITSSSVQEPPVVLVQVLPALDFILYIFYEYCTLINNDYALIELEERVSSKGYWVVQLLL